MHQLQVAVSVLIRLLCHQMRTSDQPDPSGAGWTAAVCVCMWWRECNNKNTISILVRFMFMSGVISLPSLIFLIYHLADGAMMVQWLAPSTQSTKVADLNLRLCAWSPHVLLPQPKRMHASRVFHTHGCGHIGCVCVSSVMHVGPVHGGSLLSAHC